MTNQIITKVGNFSLFAHIKHTTPTLRDADLSAIYDIVVSGKYKGTDLVSIIDAIRAEPDSKVQAVYKQRLPAFAASARYHETATQKGADQPLQHSGILGFDFDHLTPTDFDRLSVAFKADKHSALVFTSPRGEGLKRYVHVNGVTTDNHKAVYYALMLATWNRWQAVADEACVDISRLTYIGADAHAYHNSEAPGYDAARLIKQYPDAENKAKFICQQFKKGGDPTLIPVDVIGWLLTPPKPVKNVVKKPVAGTVAVRVSNAKAVAERLVQGLKETGGSITESFDQWLKVGSALKNELGEAGFVHFDELSQQDVEKYDGQECRKQWDSITTRANGANAGTLVNMGRDLAGVDASPQKDKVNVQSQTSKLTQMDIRDEVKKLYRIYYDEGAGQYYYAEPGDLNPFNFKPFSAKSNFLNELLDDLEAANIKTVKSKLEETLFNKRSFTKIKYVSKQLDWLADHYDGEDHLSKIIASVTTDDNDLFAVQFKKWMVNVVAMIYDPSPDTRNDNALILTGGQGMGKTGFFERLIWHKDWFVNNNEFKTSNKEHHLSMTNKVFILLDEMSTISKNDVKDLKALFSEYKISADKKYQETKDYDRVASFCGCSNSSDILRDDTGDRRWLVFQMVGYNRELYNSVDKGQLWGQLVSLYKSGFDFRFGGDEIKATISRNLGSYTVHKPEDSFISEELIVTGNPADYLSNAEVEKMLANYQYTHHLKGMLSVTVVRAKLALAGATVGHVRKVSGKTVRGFAGVCKVGCNQSQAAPIIVKDDFFE